MTANSITVLSFVAAYDEIIRKIQDYLEQDVTAEFLAFAEHQELCRADWLKSVKECTRLQADLDKVKQDIGDYTSRLNHARKLLDQEKKHRRRVEEERKKLEQQIVSARELLTSCGISEETKEQLVFLSNYSLKQNHFGRETKLNTSEIHLLERNLTESLLADFSYSCSDEDLDVSSITSKKWKSFRTDKIENPVSTSYRRYLSDVVEVNEIDKPLSTKTLSVPKDHSLITSSIMQAVPDDPQADSENQEPINEILVCNVVEQLQSKDKSVSIKREHSFIQKPIIKPDICESCHKRIRFGKIVLRCKDCRSVCHTECKNELSLPCNQLARTETIGTIADFTSTESPMVPNFLVHCLDEIERRGLREERLYQAAGCEEKVRTMKEKLLRNKLPPDLGEINIHVICGAVKDFLHSLQEPLITQARWNDFIQAVKAKDSAETLPCLYQAVAQLPQPNRDTLAMLMLHLMKVSDCPTCKMSVGRLSKVFGPLIVGYSPRDLDSHLKSNERRLQTMVMEQLMRMPLWEAYTLPDSKTPRNKMTLQSPSTAALPNTNGRHLFSPNIFKSAQSLRKKRKYFPTPPKY